MKRKLITIFLLLIEVHFVSSQTYVFDLIADRNETVSVDTDSNYDEKIAFLETRFDYWVEHIRAIDSEDSTITDAMTTAWEDCSCIVPWVEDYYTPIDVEVKYQYANAPHIIFVLVDDWGYNDIGYQSTYLDWTTPHVDSLASEGIKLANYFSHDSCTPSRGALMTGRVAIKTGLYYDTVDGAELPLDEFTLAQELQSAGYRTNMVGKWHLGFSSWARTPTYRGFDTFYGYYNGYIDYYTKNFGGYLDLRDNEDLVTDEAVLSSSMHNGYVLQAQAESVIKTHATDYADQPLFLYYAMQLGHFPLEPPLIYSDRCDSNVSNDQNFCGMNLMIDEAISNLTCTLAQYGMSDNTVLIVASDNGGESSVIGNSVPFRGHKFDMSRGGISAHAFIHSKLIPAESRGTTYNGQMHVSDWLPTIMGLATNNSWNGSYVNADLDGVDMWDAITNNLTSPRLEMVHYLEESGTGSIQYEMVKMDVNMELPEYYLVDNVVEEITGVAGETIQCSNPTLVTSAIMSTVQDMPTGVLFMLATVLYQQNLFIQVFVVGSIAIGVCLTIFNLVKYFLDSNNAHKQKYLLIDQVEPTIDITGTEQTAAWTYAAARADEEYYVQQKVTKKLMGVDYGTA